MDLATPRNVQLSGFFRRSNAVMNAQERIPNCLMTIINELTNRVSDVKLQYGQEAADELKVVVNKISQLREEVLQDTPFRKLISNGADVKFYNDYLEKLTSEDCRPTMLQTIRVYAECYVYRRVWECFELTKNLTNFDPYESLKQLLYWLALPTMTKTGRYLKNIFKFPSVSDKEDFEKLVKLNLWANQGDLIMSKEYVVRSFPQLLNTKKRDSFIVSNQLDEAWKMLSDRNYPYGVIAFICDNAGFDFFLEMCLADFLCTNFYAQSIHFHVKHIPWFLTDVLEKDIIWMLNQLGKSSEKHMQDLSTKWTNNFMSGRWKIIGRKYWILPFGFDRLEEIDPILFKMLKETKMIIMKGDLNYRKLFEDRNVDTSLPIQKALTGFHPSNILLIRIMKCDVVCNIKAPEFENLEKRYKNWMSSGQYGVIQFAQKPRDGCDCLGT